MSPIMAWRQRRAAGAVLAVIALAGCAAAAKVAEEPPPAGSGDGPMLPTAMACEAPESWPVPTFGSMTTLTKAELDFVATSVYVNVSAPNRGTAWTYSLGCLGMRV